MKLKIFSLLLVVTVLTIISLANTGALPPVIRALYDFDGGDKLGHFLVMGVLSFVLNWTMTASRPNIEIATAISKLSAVLALVIAAEEYSQRFFPRRTFSLLDLGCSLAGVVFGAFGVWFLRHQRHL